MPSTFDIDAIWNRLRASRGDRLARVIARLASDRSRAAPARERRRSRGPDEHGVPASSLDRLFWLPPLF
jgi:hypothetical protein